MKKQYVTSLLLASASPRRRELINRLDFHISYTSVNTNESVNQNENYKKYVSRMSHDKLVHAIAQFNSQNKKNPTVIIACDTIVVYRSAIMLKPKNIQDAKKMLLELSENKHLVLTSVSWQIANGRSPKQVHNFIETTKVNFYHISKKLLEKYLQSNQWQDKAGSYGIQDSIASLFVEKINGNYENVIGLPVARLKQELHKHISTNVQKI